MVSFIGKTMSPRIAVLVPCYNEEAAIGKVVRDFRGALPGASQVIATLGGQTHRWWVEDHVGAHPAVAMVAAVAVPDPTFGERVCAFVVLREAASLDLDGLRKHLDARGVSRDNWPERLEIVEDLPRGSGGKIAKAELRKRLRATH